MPKVIRDILYLFLNDTQSLHQWLISFSTRENPKESLTKMPPPRVFPPPAILDAVVLSMCILNYILKTEDVTISFIVIVFPE